MLEIARIYYNAALQERRDAWKQGISINYYDQKYQLKEIRESNDRYMLLNLTATDNVLRRLDETFKAFYRKVSSFW